ncbi:esterase/lipase family protein [Deinococcus navajonensis]
MFWKVPAFMALTATVLTACGSSVPEAQADVVRAQARSTAARRPVLFVHGYNSSGSVWTTMITNFKKDGWTDAQLFSWSYDTTRSNTVTADLIRQKVDAILAQTGASKVDIISHSMGGLSSRYYLKNLGGDIKVDAWVSLGGPNHGTNFANACADPSCIEMREGSTFLGSLNSTDETPGNVRYGTWWSPCDEIINPDQSVLLSGATNTQTTCLSHSQLYQNSLVYTQVRDFVSR